MSSRRIERVNELLKREVAEQMYKVMQSRDFDFSAITVTRAKISSDLHHAHVYVSVAALPGMSSEEHAERQRRMLQLMNARHAEFQAVVNKDMGLKYTPRITFRPDASIQQGDHVLELLAGLESEHPEQTEGTDDESPV